MQNPSLVRGDNCVTPQMVDLYLVFHPDLTEETAVTGLNTFADGQGELPAKLMNGNEPFYPLMQVYWNKSGNEGDMPEDWKKPLVEIEQKSSGEDSPAD